MRGVGSRNLSTRTLGDIALVGLLVLTLVFAAAVVVRSRQVPAGAGTTLSVSGDTATVVGPGGQTVTATDPRLPGVSGRLAIWEPTRQAGLGGAFVAAVSASG